MMRRKLSGLILALVFFAVPAMGEELTPEAIFGFIKDVMAVVNTLFTLMNSGGL